MAYCTQSDVVFLLPSVRLAELTDDVSGESVDTSVLARCIADADSIIDSYARGKHTVPFSPVPDNVRRWSVMLTIHCLYSRRELELPQSLKDKYDNVITELKALRDTKILIDDTDSNANTAGFYKSRGAGTTRKELFTVNSDGTGKLDDYYSGP